MVRGEMCNKKDFLVKRLEWGGGMDLEGVFRGLEDV